MIRCVLYTRVSLEEQAEQFGLASQIRALRDYAKGKGYEIVAELSDEGYSGSDLDRPAITKIREMVRSGQVDVVIAHNPDRLARVQTHQGILFNEFRQRDVRLEFVAMRLEDTPEGKVLFTIVGAFAEYEREKIRDRTLRGRQEKARQGFIVGGRVPFGYRYLGKAEGERGKLVVDQERAPIVRQIFQWAADGVSVREIARRLNEQGVQPHFAEKWGRSSVARLLKHETYVGTAYYNRLKRAQPPDPTEEQKRRKDKYTLRRQRPESEWISVPVPAILDRELFDRVTFRLARNRVEQSGRPSRRYLLRGLVWCRCGNRMCGDPAHGWPVYRCQGRDTLRKTANRCQQRARAQKLDTAVWNAICEPFRDVAVLRAAVERSGIAKPRADVKGMRRRLDALKQRETRGVSGMLGLAPEHQEILRVELRKLADQRRQLEMEIRESERAPVGIDSVLQCAREIAGVFGSELTPEQRHEALKRIVERVVVDGQDVEIRCSIPAAQNCSQHQDVVGNIERRISFTLKTRIAA